MTPPRAMLAALLLATAFLAACGEDETTTTTTTDTTTTTKTETTTTTTQEAPQGGPRKERGCGDVAFEAQTDAGAFGVRAAGTSCKTARAVAAESEGAGGGDYSARGFSCAGTPSGGELPSVEYECTGQGARITFATS